MNEYLLPKQPESSIARQITEVNPIKEPPAADSNVPKAIIGRN